MEGDAPATRPSAIIAPAIVGNALEWFDFTVYGLFSVYIGKAFFPSSDERASFLLSLATFGVGFVLRPVGAVLLGQYADRAGRRAALTLIILLMSIGTAIIAFTPGYAQIGVAAPVLIVAARLIQGFSVGGEMGGATAYLIESAPPERRGLYASWQFAGQAGAALLGSLIAAALTRLLTPAQLDAWGWRVPFLLGLAIGPVGLYMRSKMIEPREFVVTRKSARLPIVEVWRSHKRAVARSFGLTILLTGCTYLVLFYTPAYAVRELGINASDAFVAAALSSFLYLVFNPISGRLSDSIGRQRQLVLAAAAIGLSVYPIFFMLTRYPTFHVLIATQGALATLLAMFTGPAASSIGEMFPAQVRSTELSLGYNIAVPIFGGFAPFFVAWLNGGDHMAPAYYIMLCAVPTLAALAWKDPARS